MVRIAGAVVIDRPIEEVFDFVADERNEPCYNPNMEFEQKLSDGPIGAGTCYRAVTRSMGRAVEMTIEFTRYERPWLIEETTEMSAMEIRGALTFNEVPGGTRLSWSWDVAPKRVYRLMTPLIGRMGRRQEQAIWTSLKRYLESQPVVSPEPAGRSTTIRR